jgi:Tol biopolymer transport system component
MRGSATLLRINNNRREEKPIIQHDQSGWVPDKPVFSPDGTKMAVYWNRRENGGLWIISLEPYSETVLQSGIIYPVGWVLDGRYVYAVRSESGPGREIIRIQVATPNEVTSVATLPSGVYDASVSPDGHEIVVSIGESRSDVWLMENLDPSPR